MKKRNGFSVIELMTVIGIVGVISAITVPPMMSMREKYKLRASASDMLSTVKRAQSEAVKRNARVAVAFDNALSASVIFVDDGGLTPIPPGCPPPANLPNALLANNRTLNPSESMVIPVSTTIYDPAATPADPCRSMVVQPNRNVQSGNTIINNPANPFPVDITINGIALPGVEFSAAGRPLNLPAIAYAQSCPPPAPQTTGSFCAINIINPANPSTQFQILVNAFTGKSKLMTSTNGGGCFQ